MEFILADTVEKAQYVLKRAYGEATPCGWDTECHGFDIEVESPVGRAVIICFSLAGEGWKACIDGQFLHMFKDYLEDARQEKYVANLVFELHVAKCHHITLRGVRLDTVLASFTLFPHMFSHGVQAAGIREFGESKRPFKQVVPDADVVRAWCFEREEFALYSADDAMWERRLGMRLEERLRKAEWRANLPLWDYYVKYSQPFLYCLYSMEENGVLVDPEYLASAKKKASKILQDTEVELVKVLGWVPRQVGKFVNSTQELIRELYGRRNMPILKTKGQRCSDCGRTINKNEDRCPKHPAAYPSLTPSTDSDALTFLFNSSQDPLLKAILKHRKISNKLEEIRRLAAAINPATGRVHTSFSSDARSGRLKSKNPPLMNISNAEKETATAKALGFEPLILREAFLADSANGHIMFDHDQAQLEPRILAHLSADPALVKGFNEGADFYSITAKAVFKLDCDVKDVKRLHPDLRSKSKVLDLLSNYGGGVKKAAWGLGCSEDDARAVIADRKLGLAGVYAWQEQQKQNAHINGYVSNILGWRRPVPDIHLKGDDEKTRMRVGKAERVSLNQPNQSGAAELMKVVQMRLLGVPGWESELSERYRKTGARMLLQVHDEFLQEAPMETMREAADLTTLVMESPFPRPLRVPLKVEWAAGTSWAEAH